MTPYRVLCCFVMALTFTTICATIAQAEETGKTRPPAIVPQPVSVKKIDGQSFTFDAKTLTVVGRETSKESIDQAARVLHNAMGMEADESAKETPVTAKTLTLVLDDSIGKGRPDWQANESYTLTVNTEGSGVEIAASNPHGLFNGVQTFVQLADKGSDEKWRVPPVKIEDYPRFQWRGFMLDSSRHFRSKAEILRYLDLLSMHKMNVFHWHLCDNEGWRIEIKRYPQLIEVGASVPDCSGKTSKDWFYSQADVKEVVAYAADRYISVVPEIEMPGHSRAATTAYPELSCNGKPSNALCGSKESSYEFMANVLDEVVELFPAPYVHIGADEVWPEPWRACKSCTEKMKELVAIKLPEEVDAFRSGVLIRKWRPKDPWKYNPEDINRLQGEFVRRIDRHLAEKGKLMIGWDEILEGGLAKDSKAVVMAWRSEKPAFTAAEHGRDAIASPAPDCYLDIDASLKETYALEPAPASMPEEQAKHVLGVQGNMWGERTPTEKHVDRRTFPRLCALAEIGWTPRAGRDYEDFSDRLERHAERMRPYGIDLTPTHKHPSKKK
jgi:hexosaminidase